MTVAIDTNILFDILLPDPQHMKESLALLKSHGKKHRLILSETVYAELASQFKSEKSLNEFISDTDICLVNSSAEALWSAARAWKSYTQSRGSDFLCPKCSTSVGLNCSDCGAAIISRQHIISDFLIGGHALVHAGSLLTRDRGYYNRYFPELKLNPNPSN
jgi:predicted nucleic acid-binding protein